ncbi:MAG TPA: AraC family transcriptional regulator [Nocardioides sp.]
MADLIAASSLSHVAGLVTELGGDAGALLRRFRINPASVGSPDDFVPFTTVAALLAACADEVGAPDFALRLAARQDPDILGPLAIAARNADTIGGALRKVTEYAHVYSPAITSRLEEQGGMVSYEFDTVLARLPHRPHVVELALGVTLSTFRMLGGPEFHPTTVTFRHPPISAEATYRAYFGCPVVHDAPADALHFPRGLMTQRLRQVDPLAHDLAVRYLAGHDRHDAFADVVGTLVARSLPTGSASLPAVARLLVMHPRAVQRALAAEGTTFDRLVDGARRDLALRLLGSPHVPLSTVARQLGYAEQSVLTRSCRRWFGMAPLAKRREVVGRG